MSDELQILIDGYLDDQLSDEEVSRLGDLLKQNPEHSKQFAQAMLMHDRLHAEVQANALGRVQPYDLTVSIQRLPRKRWTLPAMAAAAAIFILASIFWHGGASPTASAAVVALDRMIEAAAQTVDRFYRIRVTDPGPEGAAPPVLSGGKGRKPGIDGAELYVRGLDQFVLVRHFGNGTDFITGSDGTIGWAVAPKGPVHLSHDTRRFRRAVPGEHEELPFTDLRAGLVELRRSYDLTLSPIDRADAESRAQSELVAVKKPGRRSGPERVVIHFDSEGVAHRIELFGLPADELRARAVVLNLVEQRELAPDFFKHETRHAADRPVDWE
jgi:hypothetical protein